MKKILALIMVLCLAAAALVACGSKEADYTLGIGAAVSNSGFKVTTTVASVVLDDAGKIVACRIDAVDVNKSEGDELAFAAEFATKAELGDSYGMLSDYGSSLAEWYKQAEYFEGVVVGKTADEVATIKKGDAELAAGCTIDVADFVKAVVNACKSEHKVTFKTADDITLGVSVIGAAKLGEEKVTYTADLAGTVVAGGKVVAAVIDSLEATVALDGGEAGAFEYTGTKLEKGDDYGMLSAYGSSLAEWYVQAQNFADTAVGKAPADVANLATEGVAGCTIYVGGYHKALVKAAGNVR